MTSIIATPRLIEIKNLCRKLRYVCITFQSQYLSTKDGKWTIYVMKYICTYIEFGQPPKDSEYLSGGCIFYLIIQTALHHHQPKCVL